MCVCVCVCVIMSELELDAEINHHTTNKADKVSACDTRCMNLSKMQSTINIIEWCKPMYHFSRRDSNSDAGKNVHITAGTVVQAVVKATSQSNGKGQILTPWGSETPEQISMKLGIYNRAAGMTTHANPCGAATTWVVWANTWKYTCCGFLGIPF